MPTSKMEAPTRAVREFKQQLQKAVRRLNDFDKRRKSQIEMTVTGEELRIELLESAKGTFFDSGSARPSDSGKEFVGSLGDRARKRTQ